MNLLLEKYRVEFNMGVYIDWCILKSPVTSRLSLRVGGRGFSPDYYERGPGYFHREIEEK